MNPIIGIQKLNIGSTPLEQHPEKENTIKI